MSIKTKSHAQYTVIKRKVLLESAV